MEGAYLSERKNNKLPNGLLKKYIHNKINHSVTRHLAGEHAKILLSHIKVLQRAKTWYNVAYAAASRMH